MKYKNKPTQKQQKAIEAVITNGGNMSKAMIQAGYSKAASKNPQKLTNNPVVQTELQRIMQEMGITKEMALQPLKDALIAEKQDFHTGAWMPDHTIRLAASDRLLKLQQIAEAKDTPPTPPADAKTLLDAIQNGNVSELQRVVFKDE